MSGQYYIKLLQMEASIGVRSIHMDWASISVRSIIEARIRFWTVQVGFI
jgi:hypothetical protein